ncbi:MAG: DUF6572 domain-containing protein [Chthoniobacterales bacterium]
MTNKASDSQTPPPAAPDAFASDTAAISGVSNAGVIDLFAFDRLRDEVLLVMNEARPWNGGDEQLHELQEKFNAYASFVLDGEMREAHPELAGKRARIELRCEEMPNEPALTLLGAIHDQLALQEIAVEVVVREPGCGDGCSCHS